MLQILLWILAFVILAFVILLQWISNRTKHRELSSKIHQYETRYKEAKLLLSQEVSNAASRRETLFDPMIEGVLILDDHAHIRLANKALRALFGFTNHARGKALLEVIRSHELKEISQIALDVGHVAEREWVFGTGMESRYFSINASRFEEEKGLREVILVFHDLTQARQIERGRREFVANVSHELRTPLSMIKGYVETLLGGDVSDPLLESRFLGKIKKHSDRLTYLLEDLLVLSQLESSPIALAFAKVPLASLVDRVFDDLQDRADQNDVRLESQIPKSLWVWVDPDRMQQVIRNLVDNGIKYGRREGLVSVKSEKGEDGLVKISVEDDGHGIPSNARERVFERFFRVEKARSRERGGSGLGLAIVKHIVQSHGGEVWLSSKTSEKETSKKAGALFIFTIPDASSQKGKIKNSK